MTAAFAWAAEFALETSGAIFAYRRRLTILSAYLAFNSVADMLQFFLRNTHPAYGYAWWASQAIGYLILCALACQLVSRMVEDYRPIGSYACGLAVALGAIVGYFFNRGETWANKFLDAEISASMFLVLAVAVGWIFRKRGLEGPWRFIAAGMVTFAGGTAATAFFAQTYLIALSFYPIPALAALITWNLAGIERKKIKLAEFRQPIPKKPVVSAYMPRERSRMVN